MTHNAPHRRLLAVLGASTILAVSGLGLAACGGSNPETKAAAPEVTEAEAPETTEDPTPTTGRDECSDGSEQGTLENHQRCIGGKWVDRPIERPTTTTPDPSASVQIDGTCDESQTVITVNQPGDQETLSLVWRVDFLLKQETIGSVRSERVLLPVGRSTHHIDTPSEISQQWVLSRVTDRSCSIDTEGLRWATEAEIEASTTTTEDAPTTTPPAPVETVPTPPPGPAYSYSYTVVDVVDGDTVDLSNGETVRLIGIDAPEMGACGSQEAKDAVVNGVLGRQVALESAPGILRDKYGRLLRYVIVDDYDVGGALLRAGLAIPRYNSTDGYGWHPREAEYFAIAAPPMTCAPPPAPAAPVPQGGGCDPNYSGCVPIASDVDCAGGSGNGPEYVSGPVRVIGEDIYGLDGNDNDGIGCEGSSSSGSGSGGSSGGGNSSPRNNDNPYDDGGPRNPDGSCPPGGCT